MSSKLSCYRLGVMLGLVFATAAMLFALGRFSVDTNDDSASYLQFPFHSLKSALSHIRTPVYPLLLDVVEATIGLQGLPIVHFVLHVGATLVLLDGLVRCGVPPWQRIVTAGSVLIGCAVSDNVHLVATDLPAVSLGVIVVGVSLSYTCHPTVRCLFLLSMLILVTILTRPAYLFLIGFAPLATCCLVRLRGGSWSAATYRFGVVLAGAALPTVLFCTVRLAVVGHFHVVAFGSQNLAGIAVQFLNGPMAEEMEGETRAFALDVVAKKDAWYEHHAELSEGYRYQAMEDRWNPMIFDVVVPVARTRYGDDSLARHRQISWLNAEIFRRRPIRYAVWILLATRQTVRILLTDIALHPPFLLVIIIGACVLVVVPTWRGHPLATSSTSLERDPSSYIVLTIGPLYFSLAMIPVILTSAPLGRFVDAAAIFMPAVLACLCASCFAQLFSNSRQRDGQSDV